MSKVISKDGTPIVYDRSGNGSPIILVDGAFCSRTIGPMGPLAALLSERFTVFTYDRRGRGESGDTAPYAVEREIEDLEALINEAGRSASVFGMSSGGVLALKAAGPRGRPGLTIKKLAVYEPPLAADENVPRPPKDHQEQLSSLAASGRRGEAVEYFMTKVVGQPIEAATEMRQTPMWSALEAVAHTLAYDAAICADYSLPIEQFAAITVATLAINGGASPAWMRQTAQAIADTLPNAQTRTLDGQDHNVAVEILAPVLEQFFAG